MFRARRRDSGREQFWRDTVAAWKRSGESVRAYCLSRGLSEASFYGWRRTLKERDQQPAPRCAPMLVPVRVVPDAVLEVVLPSGLVVRVPARADASTIATLVAALRTAAC
jgi:transposase